MNFDLLLKFLVKISLKFNEFIFRLNIESRLNYLNAATYSYIKLNIANISLLEIVIIN